MGPAPGLHKLRNLGYMQIHYHLLAWISPLIAGIANFNAATATDTFEDLALEELLSPKLEVLKITSVLFSPQGMEIVDEILENGEEVVPRLRRIILHEYYVDEEEAIKLRAVAEEAKTFARAREELEAGGIKGPASSFKDMIVSRAERCKAKGIELVVLCENVVGKELLQKGT
ncbi:hypothetical protein ONS95_006590 [Cadophora gregata]|uniref:uncharacterized protein n=1 Tax=Cadophora gregata TaxID=51156 RepID=UPI0026DC20FA|nr:uncharacterized protein ONS95_006590 [Cadophora gregata]KAK0101418.1 hypothetical protein ONS95_006590 [Cadophora gregata]KAK0106571.1 hypothetical protein ONS96_004193 [Cadophora gregata f. sp. sojae]